ncbi:MAG: patatin-like phospholipase family protein [Chitinophagaceae bacterium]
MAIERLEEYGEVIGLDESIASKLKEAQTVREFILHEFVTDIDSPSPQLKNTAVPDWILATVAEAYFGIRKYSSALQFIVKYVHASAKNPWEIRTFSQQLFSIAYIQQSLKKLLESKSVNGLSIDPAKIAEEISIEGIVECLSSFVNDNVDGSSKSKIEPRIKKGGKVGLALSGGGFRASLFHIGVLAALAEKDELRNIEVLSCVSGGSIIGAYYYIKLKKLLESTEDVKLGRNDYIKLIQETEKDFLRDIQKNLRVRIFSNLFSNIKMLFGKNYSRTHRLGELYEKHLFKKLWNEKNIYMDDLFIQPKGTDESFDIAIDNWKRLNKVPQLVLNATSVNTGHNWQFTASWMGEPPGNIQADIDVKPRLRRMYYKEAPDPYKKFRLGYAVGASSCVPVMFHPMPMFGLYPEVDLQLVDGGLHDNQGIAALIEQECHNMIISDASGQLPTKNISTDNEAAIFYRTDNLLQERLRELQFMDLKERHYTYQLNQLITLHLKNDLMLLPINWKYCVDPPRTLVYSDLNQLNKVLTTYGILKTVQTYLSEIRTDLDAFNDIEANALMYSGYLQTHYEWNKNTNATDYSMDEQLWHFSGIREYVTDATKASEIETVLKTANKLFFKVLYLNKVVKIIGVFVILCIALALIYFIARKWNAPVTNLTVKGLVIIILLFALGYLSTTMDFILNGSAKIKKWIALLGISIFGCLASWFYLIFLNPLYKKAGIIKNSKKPQK